jgi:hypothetical protein
MLSRFLVLVALYTTCMFIGNMHFRLDDVRLTGHHTRVFVAALQVMIVSALVCVHTIFMFFIRIVKQERTAFVLVSHHKATQGGQAEGEGAVCVDETGTPAGSEREMCDASSVRVDAESETLSVASDALGMNIVFESSINLDLYFLYVTVVGLVLWTTFIAFNFALYDSIFAVASGMVIGWVINQLSSECRCHESPSARVPRQKVRILCYCGTSVLITCLGLVNWIVPDDMASALFVYAQFFCAGVFWTAVAPEVAFTGGKHVSRGILYDTRRSLPTFLLVVAVGALSTSPETSSLVFVYIAHLSQMAALHLLLVEPVLIFLSLYVMIIALERRRSADFAIVLVLVEGIYIAHRSETYDATVITGIVASIMLFGAHAAHLLRG